MQAGPNAAMGYQKELTSGRWMRGPDETVIASEIARERGLNVGDTLTIQIVEKTDASKSSNTNTGRTSNNTFGVTASGVRLDHFPPADAEGARARLASFLLLTLPGHLLGDFRFSVRGVGMRGCSARWCVQCSARSAPSAPPTDIHR